MAKGISRNKKRVTANSLTARAAAKKGAEMTKKKKSTSDGYMNNC